MGSYSLNSLMKTGGDRLRAWRSSPSVQEARLGAGDVPRSLIQGLGLVW